MQNTGIPTQVFHYRLGGRRNPERPRRDGRPVAGTMHNRIRRTAKTKRALEPCYKKHNSVPTPHWWICAPTYENLLYAVKSGRKPVVGENWDPQSTADGDKTAWQGGITHRHFSLLALNTNTRFPLHSINRSTAHPFIVRVVTIAGRMRCLSALQWQLKRWRRVSSCWSCRLTGSPTVVSAHSAVRSQDQHWSLATTRLYHYSCRYETPVQRQLKA